MEQQQKKMKIFSPIGELKLWVSNYTICTAHHKGKHEINRPAVIIYFYNNKQIYSGTTNCY